MILWTDWLALVLLTIVTLILLRRLKRRSRILQVVYSIGLNPLHYQQVKMLRRFQLSLKILLPTVWILILIATVL